MVGHESAARIGASCELGSDNMSDTTISEHNQEKNLYDAIILRGQHPSDAKNAVLTRREFFAPKKVDGGHPDGYEAIARRVLSDVGFRSDELGRLVRATCDRELGRARGEG